MAETRIRRREEIPDEYKWRLEDLFATEDEWEAEYGQTLGLAGALARYQGKLGTSVTNLLEFLGRRDALCFHRDRLYVYAHERYHQDTKETKYQGLAERADRMMTETEEALAFFAPEILAFPEESLGRFFEEEPRLEQYRRLIEEIRRDRDHVLSPEQEEILAMTGEMATAPRNIFSMINDADIHFHSFLDMEGNRVRVTHGNLSVLLKDRHRSTRESAWHSVHEAYQKWGNTVTAVFLANLKKDQFYAKVRRFSSARAMHLNEGNIPESVYDNLIETVHRHLPAMHRYVRLRKERLGLRRLRMYDMYLPLADAVDREYSWQDARELVIRALAPMGEEYLAIFSRAFDEGWIDVYENENKRSGAYSWSAYGTHPYVLMNYQSDLGSVFTLAHEMGHAIHSYYSAEAQPVTYAEYLIFVAEVASTCNESLLMSYLLEHSEDEREKTYLLNHQLEQFRTTVFRQTMFAEFEHIAHSRLAKGESVTRESLCKLYRELNQLYYGDALYIDADLEHEWMRIPHFYTPYYVYQYATGYSAAVALSDRIRKEGEPAVERYIDGFLKGGCSKDPIDLLRAAGVDMSKPEPVDQALCVFEEYLEAFEKALQ